MPPTPLIGRKAQIEAARRLLQCAEVRLLTLTGAGGVGKTSLALAVAAELAGAREQGIHFVDLAAVTESDQVPLAIARGLRLPDERTDGRWDRLLWTMRKQHLLIVLDNFEQVIDAASSVGELVVACPNVRVLVTSRSPLRLRSEYVLPVRPLELPDRGQSSDVEAVLRSPAGALFVQRARAVDPDFTLTPSTAQAVVEICARLDGLPLAIELAAGRTQLLTPNEILARLQQPLDLLEGGPRDQPPRHQSLRAAIAWSYDLMRPAEQALLGLLAVFVGGAALETVEAIALSSAAQSTLASRLDMVASLVDKSLLRRETPPARDQGQARFRILETVRAFALERLAANGETAVAQRLHATAMLAVVRHADAGLVGSTQALWLERIDQEQDDIRVALRWAIDRDEPRLGLEMAAALRQYWRIRGHLHEGRAWLEELLAQPGAAAAALERSRALHAAGSLALCQGEYAAAHAALEESSTLAREADDLRTLALALGELGRAAYEVGDHAAAQPVLAEAVELSHARGDAGAEAHALQHLGLATYELGDAARAVEMVRRSLGLQQRLGDTWGTATALVALAQVAEAGDGLDDPRSLLEESLRLTQELGDQCTLVEAAESLAALAMEQGQAAQAMQLLGGASAAAESLGMRRFGIRLNRIKRTLEVGRQLLGQEAYASAWANGRAMLPEQVAEYALERAGRPIAPLAVPTPIRAQKRGETWLTRREREVVDLLARGMTNRQIADALVIAERTAETHVCNILGKLRLSSRSQVAAWAVGGPIVAIEAR